MQLANAIYPVINEDEPLQQALAVYTETFNKGWQKMMAAKLGLTNYRPEDGALIAELELLLQAAETDMTIFYRQLALLDTAKTIRPETAAATIIEPVRSAFYRDVSDSHTSRLATWLRQYAQRRYLDGRDDSECRDSMNLVNPKYVLRNYLAQLAIDKAEKEDYSMIYQLAALLRKPYDEQPEYEDYAGLRPDWAKKKAGCSMLSCSS